MSCKVIVAPPASRKTHYCLDRIFQCLERAPLVPAWMVAPDNLQVAGLRRRVAGRGGALGLNIGTFGDLYQLILRRAGISLPVMSEIMGLRLTGGVIQAAGEKGELMYFDPIRGTPGLRAALHERFKEFERALVEPEELSALPDIQGGSLAELARLYGAYRDRLVQLGWMDSAGMNRRACQALQEDPALVDDIPILVLDGFDSFNPSQIWAIGLLGAAIPEVLVTLAGAEGWGRLPHRRFERTLDSLVRGINCSVDYYDWRPRLPADLAHLESHLFATGSGAMHSGTAVEMISARSPAAEARESLRWLKARIRRDEFHLDQCAIVCPDFERYRPFLREVAREYGIPLRFSQGYPLRRAPSIHALRNLLALPMANWPRRALLSLIRSPYFDLSRFDLKAGDSAPLEDVSLHGQVTEGLDQWVGILTQLASRPTDPDAAGDEDWRLPNLPRGAQADALLRGLVTMGERLSVFGRRTAEDWVRWLEDLLDELRYFDLQREPRDEAAGLALRETLRGLVLSEGVLGRRRITAQQFVSDLESALDAAAFEIRMDWRMPAVRVLGVLEARGARFEALAVLGLSESLFPEVEREDPFLGEDVRGRLGLDARLGREQAGLFYQIVTRADRRLLLTRPYLADDGERWAASPFWRATAAVSGDGERRLSGETPRPLNDAGSRSELLFWAALAGGLPDAFRGAFLPEWDRLLTAQEILQARLTASPAGPYEGGAAKIRPDLERRYGAPHVWSASQLETYGTCPFMFYASSALGLEGREPPEPGIDPAQLGALLHAILESTYSQAENTADTDSILQSLEPVAGAEFSAAPERYGFRPNALWEVEKEQLLEILRETIRNLEGIGEGWIPTAFEEVFGIRGRRPLELEHDGQTYRLGGIIDRVDRRGASQIRVIDYKTGSRHLSYQDLVEGRRLQLPLYALAARDALDLGEPVEGFYWLIMRAECSSLRLARFRPRREGGQLAGPEAAIRVSIQHLASYVSAVRRGEFPPKPPEDGCPDYCPAAAWCWRYNPGW